MLNSAKVAAVVTAAPKLRVPEVCTLACYCALVIVGRWDPARLWLDRKAGSDLPSCRHALLGEDRVAGFSDADNIAHLCPYTGKARRICRYNVQGAILV